MGKFFKKLEQKRIKYFELQKELSSEECLRDREMYKTKSKEYANLKELIGEYQKYLALNEEKENLESMVSGDDPEYAQLAQKELDPILLKMEEKRKDLENLLLDEDSIDLKKNAIIEIRAGTGGVEAGLFAADLYKMYSRYIDNKGWKQSVISLSETEKGGIKEIIFLVEGHNVFKIMRFEMGTHRVQRVPETEASGRIHTSAATVAVLPEADEVELNIKQEDVKIDVYRASGAGGQHVNTTDSAVRITHLPTGIVVSCQDERSQHKNKAKGMKVLYARILEKMQEDQRKEISLTRKKQIGSGDRSEKIRTYNFPENRVTDHRINLTIHNLQNILVGEIEEILKALSDEDRKLRLEDGAD